MVETALTTLMLTVSVMTKIRVCKYDSCGVCNGPGAIYECGCEDIPQGNCDCDGNVLDALGDCGGDCPDDADADGICDDEDPCVVSTIHVECVTDREPSTSVDVRIFLKETVIVMGT